MPVCVYVMYVVIMMCVFVSVLVIICQESAVSLVVVEGGSKGVAKFVRLMMKR